MAWLLLALLAQLASGQNLEPHAKALGATFCKFLAYKAQIPRKWFNLCGEPSCNWDDWTDAKVQSSKRVVVSYGHNGFGNQLWEHSVAFMVAESLQAQMLVAIIPDDLSPNGYIPPNSWQGMAAMERMLPPQFLYESLPLNSSIRALCDAETFVVADRPIDWRNSNYTSHFKQQVLDIIQDPNPRCIKLVGYFQNLPLCAEDAKKLWTPKLFQNATIVPGANDMSIYLRCLPRHYHFNTVHFYESILNHTSFDNVWLFQAPECPTQLNENPAKDGMVASVIRLLTEKYGAKRWPGLAGVDGTTLLLHDLAGLAMSKKLILPVSSWAFWGGLLSNATEIHVDAPPHHAVMSGSHQYTYHNEKTGEYFGKYLPEQNDIVYRAKEKMVNHHHARLHARLKAQSILHTNSNNSAVGEYVENKDNSTGTGTGTEAGAVEVVAVVVDAPICAGGVCGPSGVETLNTSRLPVVFVFTVVPTLCVRGLPSYIKTALQQAMFTQPDCDVLLVSNFKDCASVRESVKELTTLKLVDSSLMASNRTVWYNRICSNMFRSDGVGELWMTSALRFFIIEDLMRESGTMKSGTTKSGYRELLHIEADNMLYGKLSSLLPVLRSGYPGLAATPLTAKTNMITASVFWVSAISDLAAAARMLQAGRPAADKEGNGIKPFAINEMTMLAHYHHLHPHVFKQLPVVPAHSYNLNRYVVNMSTYGPGGDRVGPATGHGIWDPNSWGQLVGGTSRKRGRDKGFSEQAIRMNGCTLAMLCGNQSTAPYAALPQALSPYVNLTSYWEARRAGGGMGAGAGAGVGMDMGLGVGVGVSALSDSEASAFLYWQAHLETQCYTAPFVRCSEQAPWTPLWNLHVHSKATPDYLSQRCPCP
eukprot:CAMPEP_0173303164 /NCGR_PEP_ID=MMETSP1143-20121109/18744_1 /TAXON_ID=483371 /ORGANISM="non described non described, Strain CCMP2298" /LENGTH=872 /DNA_ID=CAMNT_0014243857 /DNA_START=97 /DNA_END=2716 /DNA_ORIENTATION=+